MNRISIVFYFAVAMVFISVPIMAENSDPTSIIKKGLAAYKVKGPKEAVTVWLKGSALEESKEALSQANNFSKIEEFYGKYEDFEIIKTYQISNRTVIICLVMNYEKGPVYARIDVFKKSNGDWVTAQFEIHTKILNVFPTQIIFKD